MRSNENRSSGGGASLPATRRGENSLGEDRSDAIGASGVANEEGEMRSNENRPSGGGASLPTTRRGENLLGEYRCNDIEVLGAANQ